MKRLLQLCCVLGCVTAARGAEPTLINGIKAIVDDSIITVGEVDSLTEQAVRPLSLQYASQPAVFRSKLQEAAKDNLDHLIANELILKEFKKFNLPETLLDQDVDKQIQEMIRTRYSGDRMRFVKTLQARGMSLERLRKQFRDEIIITWLRQKNVSSEVIISPHKVESYYLAHREEFKMEDEIKLRMIVLKQSPDDEGSQTLKRAGEILGKLKEGAAFAEMATIYSEGSQRKDGGDWGWWEHTRLSKGLADIAFSMKPEEISKVLSRSAGEDYWMIQYEGEQPTVGRRYATDNKTKKESMVEEINFASSTAPTNLPTPVEFYVMLVEDKHATHYKSLGEVRDEIEKTLLLEERSRLEKEWIARLRKQTFVRLM